MLKTNIVFLLLSLIVACADDSVSPTDNNQPPQDDGMVSSIADNQSPQLTITSFITSNDNATLAYPSDVITVEVSATEAIFTPTVSIGGKTATSVTGSSASWTAMRTLGDIETAGSITVTIEYRDIAGNSGETVTENSLTNTISFALPKPEEPKWVQVWSDEFSGSQLNAQDWNYQLGNGCPGLCGWGNNEQQIYRKENVSIVSLNSDAGSSDGSYLQIQARLEQIDGSQQYTSARINTSAKVDFRYGRVQVRAQLPAGAGTWPAAWLLPTEQIYGNWPNSGEIDILETQSLGLGGQNDLVGTIHFDNLFGKKQNGNTTTPAANLATSFNMYELVWSSDVMRFYLNGKLYHTINRNIWNFENLSAPFDQYFHILLNLALGGDFVFAAIDNNIFPVNYLIDYVRVFCANSANGTEECLRPNSFSSRTGLPITFEPGSSAATGDFGGNSTVVAQDPANATNGIVARTRDGIDARSGTIIRALDNKKIPYVTGKQNNITLQIYPPAVGIPITMRVESANSNREITVNTTQSNQWQTLTFSFNNTVDVSNTYDVLSILFNDGNSNSGQDFYWDNVQFKEGETATITANLFAGSLITNDFGTATLSLTKDESDGSGATVTFAESDHTTVVHIVASNSEEFVSWVQLDPVQDISNYSAGNLAFDIFVVKNPTNPSSNYLVKLENPKPANSNSDEPVQGAEVTFASQSAITLNTWQSFQVPIADLNNSSGTNFKQAFSLANIDKTVFLNNWGMAAAAEFYLDNIRITATGQNDIALYNASLAATADIGSFSSNNAGNAELIPIVNAIEVNFGTASQATVDLNYLAAINFSDYSTLTFDIKIIAKPSASNADYRIKATSSANCSSCTEVVFANAGNYSLDTWYPVSVTIADFNNSYNDLTEIMQLSFFNSDTSGSQFLLSNIQLSASGLAFNNVATGSSQSSKILQIDRLDKSNGYGMNKE